MKVHQHSTTNMILKAPHGMVNCETVPATMCLDGDEVRICTYWRPTPEELDRLNCGDTICLHVFGRAHPPVALTVEAP